MTAAEATQYLSNHLRGLILLAQTAEMAGNHQQAAAVWDTVCDEMIRRRNQAIDSLARIERTRDDV